MKLLDMITSDIAYFQGKVSKETTDYKLGKFLKTCLDAYVEARECPICGSKLIKVVFPRNSMLNEEQFDSAKNGDYFCTLCKDGTTGTGYKYFWEFELPRLGSVHDGEEKT